MSVANLQQVLTLSISCSVKLNVNSRCCSSQQHKCFNYDINMNTESHTSSAALVPMLVASDELLDPLLSSDLCFFFHDLSLKPLVGDSLTDVDLLVFFKIRKDPMWTLEMWDMLMV